MIHTHHRTGMSFGLCRIQMTSENVHVPDFSSTKGTPYLKA